MVKIMYRIKFDKELKELERYGYEEDKQGNYSKRVMKDSNKAYCYFETIEINKDDRIIRTRLYQDAADQEWIGYIEKTGRYIYDLEKAGLLEEVKDNRIIQKRTKHNSITNKKTGQVPSYMGEKSSRKEGRIMGKKEKYLNNCEECDECEYIGEGDFACMKYDFPAIVKEEWSPTDYYNNCKKCREYIPKIY